MKSFKQILSEVAQPNSEDELNFKEKHIIDHILDPNSEEDQFTADEIKKFKNHADYAPGEDKEVYEQITLKRDYPGQEDHDIDNDGDSDFHDMQYKLRKKLQIKHQIVDEEIEPIVPSGGEYDSEESHVAYKKKNKKISTPPQFEEKPLSEPLEIKEGLYKLEDGSSIILNEADSELLTVFFNKIPADLAMKYTQIYFENNDSFDNLIELIRD